MVLPQVESKVLPHVFSLLLLCLSNMTFHAPICVSARVVVPNNLNSSKSTFYTKASRVLLAFLIFPMIQSNLLVTHPETVTTQAMMNSATIDSINVFILRVCFLIWFCVVIGYFTCKTAVSLGRVGCCIVTRSLFLLVRSGVLVRDYLVPRPHPVHARKRNLVSQDRQHLSMAALPLTVLVKEQEFEFY